jgi:predicted aspartyl protease
MGTTYAEITLKNAGDVIKAEDGYIKESEIRETTIEVVADTGADTLVINEEVRAALGLRIKGSANAWLADGAHPNCVVTEPVEVHWKDRSMICQPWVLPNAREVLLGAIPLENMDLIVDPVEQCVVGKHGDIQVAYIR